MTLIGESPPNPPNTAGSRSHPDAMALDWKKLFAVKHLQNFMESHQVSVGRYSFIAMLMLVVLRLAIGWQMFYEGVWKLKTLRTPKPWTSAGYLKNSQGPMRATFRRMTGDPDDLDWLDAKKVEKRWKDWQKRFTRHHGLSKNQAAKLNNIVTGPGAYYSDKGVVVPESVDLTTVSARLDKQWKQVVTYDDENKRLKVDRQVHMSPREMTKLLDMLPKPNEDGEITESEDEAKFREQLNKVYLRNSRLSYVEKLKAELLGNREWTGNKSNQQVGELEKYRDMLADYEVAVSEADQDFEFDHLQKMWKDVQTQRASLVGPIKALEVSMMDDAEKLLTTKQARMGSVAKPWTSLRIADGLTIAGLTILGLCLIAGFFTRFSAIMAAIMIFSFYLAMPPLPGLPDAPGPEHSFIINKNLIEVLALLAIAALPTGRWFGLDAVIRGFFGKKQTEPATA